MISTESISFICIITLAVLSAVNCDVDDSRPDLGAYHLRRVNAAQQTQQRLTQPIKDYANGATTMRRALFTSDPKVRCSAYAHLLKMIHSENLAGKNEIKQDTVNAVAITVDNERELYGHLFKAYQPVVLQEVFKEAIELLESRRIMTPLTRDTLMELVDCATQFELNLDSFLAMPTRAAKIDNFRKTIPTKGVSREEEARAQVFSEQQILEARLKVESADTEELKELKRALLESKDESPEVEAPMPESDTHDDKDAPADSSTEIEIEVPVIDEPETKLDLVEQPETKFDVVDEPKTKLDVVEQPETNIDVVEQPKTKLDLLDKPKTRLDVVDEPKTKFDVVDEPEAKLDVVEQPEIKLNAVEQPETKLDAVEQPETKFDVVEKPKTRLDVMHEPENKLDLVDEPKTMPDVVDELETNLAQDLINLLEFHLHRVEILDKLPREQIGKRDKLNIASIADFVEIWNYLKELKLDPSSPLASQVTSLLKDEQNERVYERSCKIIENYKEMGVHISKLEGNANKWKSMKELEETYDGLSKALEAVDFLVDVYDIAQAARNNLAKALKEYQTMNKFIEQDFW